MCNGYRLNRILDALAVLISENEDPKSPRTQKDRACWTGFSISTKLPTKLQ